MINNCDNSETSNNITKGATTNKKPVIPKLNLAKIRKKITIKKERLNVLDLFCGCGGMSKGLQNAGLNVIAGIDIWDKAIDSYKKISTIWDYAQI